MVISLISDEIKYYRFKRKVQLGTKLHKTFKSTTNEFDKGYTFHIIIVRRGKKQVIVRYKDGSERNMFIQQLYDENWIITNPKTCKHQFKLKWVEPSETGTTYQYVCEQCGVEHVTTQPL